MAEAQPKNVEVMPMADALSKCPIQLRKVTCAFTQDIQWVDSLRIQCVMTVTKHVFVV